MQAVDPHQIEQVIVNLVINAMDALPEGGNITFSTRILGQPAGFGNSRRFRLTVQDSGAGMPAEHINNVFDPFFSTKEDGTGLGLPLSLGIIENHGGRIRLTSQEGVGTTVYIEWPEHTELTAQAQEEKHEDHIGR